MFMLVCVVVWREQEREGEREREREREYVWCEVSGVRALRKTIRTSCIVHVYMSEREGERQYRRFSGTLDEPFSHGFMHMHNTCEYICESVFHIAALISATALCMHIYM